MIERINQELELLRLYFPEVEYVEAGQWVLIRKYPTPDRHSWDPKNPDVCFQIPIGYPGTPPDWFHVTAGITCNGQKPGSYTEPANHTPPFPGKWGSFSWHMELNWRPTADINSGSNLLNFARTFTDRFQEGV